MLASYLLRVLLLMNEGQFHFPDENLYRAAAFAAEKIYQSDFTDAFNGLLRYERHPGADIVGLVPAVLHRAIFQLDSSSGQGWTDYWYSRHSDFRLSAMFFIVPSVLAIGMIFVISRETGAGEIESLLGAFFLAISNTIFMYSQHFLPYDFSLLIGLFAIWLIVNRGRRDFRPAVLVGALTFFMFWTYHGHVTLAITIALVYCVFLAPDIRTFFVRAFGMVTGSLLLLAPLFLYNLLVFDSNIISTLLWFSTSVKQGDFEQGIILPILYFADADSGIGVVWALGIMTALWRIWHDPEKDSRHRAKTWVICVLILYVLMAVFSNGMRMFVVYGRIARALMPFIAMLSAYAFAPLIVRYGLRVAAPIVLIVALLAIGNFLPIMHMNHYRMLQRHVYANYKDVSFESTFGPSARRFSYRGAILPDARYKLINAGYFFPITELHDPPDGKVVYAVPHPYTVRAFQYEGMTAAMRDLINSSDLKMWLIDTHSKDN